MIRKRTPLGDLVTNVKTIRQDGTVREHIKLESEPLELAPEPRRRDQYDVFNDRSLVS